ncbi:ABC transporter substrate-binding protein [Paenibacillus xylaniclasticus]|uniref:ABC transporter substrate-binding protein n=1 Tax=Paenibacillus xylaniclasticus TaxID=588083 RepID=UPI000FD8B0C2|nr:MULTISPECIES: ABC transporter substrate-binding protein [Paenibacillus]GFN30077.1 heme-binding protein A [Paenibacillus curdlanolyticus]
MGKRGVIRAVTVLLAVSVIMTACSSKSEPSSNTSSNSGGSGSGTSSLVIATPSLPSSLEVENAIGYENQEAALNMHATLIRNTYVDKGEGLKGQEVTSFEPVLAESYEVSEDGLSVTFRLKQGVLSPDGNELNADDVIYSMKRKMGTGSTAGFIGGFVISDVDQQVLKIDEYTVQFKLNKNTDYTLLSMLSNSHLGSIYDSDLLLSKKTDDDPWSLEYASKNSYGFGPYKVVEYKPGQQLVWESNENYVLGEPYYKRIVVKEVKDTSTRVSLLRGGDVQIATQLRPRDQEALKDDPNITIPAIDTNMHIFIPLNTSVAPFDNQLVRQAMAYAIPYDRIQSQVYLNRSASMSGPMFPDIPGYDSTPFEQYTYDPAKAKELLAEAGFANGITVKMTYNTSYADLKEVANMIKTGASEAGITIELQEMPASSYAQAKSSGSLQMMLDRDYSIVLSPYYLLLLFFNDTSPLNWSKWVNQSYLDAVNTGATSTNNELSEEAQQYWKEAQQILGSELPFIWVNYVQPLQAMRSSVTGFAFRTDNVIAYELLKPAAE